MHRDVAYATITQFSVYYDSYVNDAWIISIGKCAS